MSELSLLDCRVQVPVCKFPLRTDTFVNPLALDDQDSPDHAKQHQKVNDILYALENIVGVGGILSSRFLARTGESPIFANITDSALTSGQIPLVSTAGLFISSPLFTYSLSASPYTITLTVPTASDRCGYYAASSYGTSYYGDNVANIGTSVFLGASSYSGYVGYFNGLIHASNIDIQGLTSGRLTLVGTSGLLIDSSLITYAVGSYPTVTSLTLTTPGGTDAQFIAVSGSGTGTYGGYGFNCPAGTLSLLTAGGVLKATATTGAIAIASAGTDFVKAGTATTGQIYETQVTDTVAGGTWTSDWSAGKTHYIVLGNNAHTAPTLNNPVSTTYKLYLRQPPSGAAGTVSWPAAIHWRNGAAPVLSVTNDRVDVIILNYNSVTSTYYGDYGPMNCVY